MPQKGYFVNLGPSQIAEATKKASRPCGLLAEDVPRCVVCLQVLNLLSQVGAYLSVIALRTAPLEIGSLCLKCWLKTLSRITGTTG